MANQIRGVLYLQRDRFLLALDSRVDVLTYIFPPTLVSNLDILDADGLKQNLTDYIKQNKISFTNLVIVLSNGVIFEQDFKTAEEPLIQEFLENVPYETISIKKVAIQGGTKVLIGNATFYMLLADVFKQNGTVLDYVIPEKALGAPISSFNVSTARLILTQFEALSQYKFVVDASTEVQTDFNPPERKTVVVHKKNYTLMYSLPIFILLLIVLLFMVLQPIIFKEKSKTVTLASTIPSLAPSNPSPILVVTQPAASPSASSQLKTITTVQIIYDPTSSPKVDAVKAELTKLGITNVQTIASPSDIAAPIVLISTSVEATNRQKVVKSVKNILPTSIVQDSANQSTDMIITIGKIR